MENLGLVLFRSAVWLTAFAVIYILLLRNERYFRLNRIYLLSGIIASLLFPFYTFRYIVLLPVIASDSVSAGELSAGSPVISETGSLPSYYWIYLAGITLFLFRLLYQSWKLLRKLHEAGYKKTGGVKLVRSSEFVSSFSFFSFVFVNPSVEPFEMEEIIRHEREHIRQRHWFDLLLAELICIVQWFNPFAWIYARLIRQNHEYLADESALEKGSDPAFYRAALLNQLLGEPVLRLTNSFSYSLNKKRFNMMKKTIDSPLRKLKLLLVLPMAAMLFYAFSAPEYQYGTDNNVLSPQDKTVTVKGQVLKADGNPLPGTSVVLKGSTIGTMSGPEGRFELKGIPEDGEIFFTFVGFKTVVQKVSTQPMKILMEVANVGIEKITVTAYGTPPPPPPAGKDNKGQVVIRGQGNGKNEPLVILDGVEIPQSEMNKVSPDQIESVDVLKEEASTAKYGEKGKHGVILITTKAKAGQETSNAKTVVGYPIDPPALSPPPPGGKSGNEQVVVVGYGKNQPAQTGNPLVITGPDKENPPLFILDGAEITQKQMEGINPDQIESISVLKDKSATVLYGDKGKNGVVLITSKGKAARDPKAVSEFNAQVQEKLSNPPKGEEVFVVVEEMPEFPGGLTALRGFIAREIRYPAEARKNKIQGKVFVSFVVSSTGKVTDSRVVKSVNPLLDTEALRVVTMMPDWKPAKQRGQAVSVAYTVPIEFILQ